VSVLEATELAAACAAVRAAHPAADGDLRFPVVALVEPGRRDGPDAPRQVEVVVVERRSGLLSEVVVDAGTSAVVSWNDVPSAHPPLLFDECMVAIDAVRSDPRWQASMAARGITDLADVQIDPWPPGYFGLPVDDGRRLARCVTYLRDAPTDNGYAHPVEGLLAVVDLATGEVVEVSEHGAVPVPPGSGRYGIDDVGPLRTGLRPLAITQTEGPSFTLDGNSISWLGWELSFAVRPIEGLVLYDVSYQGRPILHRAGIAEMVVPYGAAGANHWWKNAFDVGEWGLGRMIQSLSLGCDCLGEIRYADAVLPDEFGGARVVANAVCLHEEDYGILWKHVDMWNGTDEVRRSRRMVISSVSTVGNYEYGFFWYLYLDGTIQLEVKLTGIMQTGACDPTLTEAPDNGVLVAPGLWAPNHQHLFCARLDMTVDGPHNSVEEIDVVGDGGSGIIARTTLLTGEVDAQRVADPAASRRWRIFNPATGTAYSLLPTAAVRLLADPETWIGRRAGFAAKSLWVTPDTRGQRRPAGEYPSQSRGGGGLPEWTADDRSVVDTDVVVWHTFGVSHLPRPEDWPVMPVEYAGFMLKPTGFFARNPALDLPPPAGHCS
jgi:primary-amine oxidase